jgi:hypothetical protein
MQELMQIIDIKSMVHNDKEVLMILSNLKAHATDLLQKEKMQIVKAMNYSTYREMKGINVSNEEYYNKTYNN